MDGGSFCKESHNGIFNQFTKKHLRRQLSIERDHRYVDRIRIILLLDKGWSYDKIAEAFFIDKKTITNYKKRYLDDGIEGLINDAYVGRATLLTGDEKRILEKDLEANLFTSAKEIIKHVEKKFGVRYSLSGMRYLLFTIGFSFKKAKGVPAKANIEAQKRFIQSYRRLIKRLQKSRDGKAVKLYFIDATHHLGDAGHNYPLPGTSPYCRY